MNDPCARRNNWCAQMFVINVFLKGCCAPVGPLIFIKTVTHDDICFIFFKDNSIELQLHVIHEYNHSRLGSNYLTVDYMNNSCNLSCLNQVYLQFASTFENIPVHERDVRRMEIRVHVCIHESPCSRNSSSSSSLTVCLHKSFIFRAFFGSLANQGKKKNSFGCCCVEAKLNLKVKTLSG